jgi:glutathione S-transferase
MASSTEKFSTARKDKDFTLYTHDNGPNGWRVNHLLQELGLEYENVYLDFYNKVEHKSPGMLRFEID